MNNLSTPTIEIGSRVRSFDFDSRDLTGPNACFIEGELEGTMRGDDCERYVIRVTRCVFAGEERPYSGVRVYPPVNGTPTSLGNTTNGVEVVS